MLSNHCTKNNQKKVNRPEQAIQQAIVKYFAYQYPKLKGLLCANLNNSKDKVTGGINKSMGVVSGRSDMVLYYNNTAYHIEIKEPKGKQSTIQKEWQKTIEDHGFCYYICYSLNDFILLMKAVVNTNNNVNVFYEKA